MEMCPGGAIGAQEITGDNAREDRQADKKNDSMQCNFPISPHVCHLFGWLDGRSVGRYVGWSVG